jgi:hypothetical protein
MCGYSRTFFSDTGNNLVREGGKGIRQPMREANRSPPSSVEIKSEWNNTSTSPHAAEEGPPTQRMCSRKVLGAVQREQFMEDFREYKERNSWKFLGSTKSNSWKFLGCTKRAIYGSLLGVQREQLMEVSWESHNMLRRNI